MVILVTGGAGFVGTSLIQSLLNSNHTVISVDDYSSGEEVNHVKDSKVTYFSLHTSTLNVDFFTKNKIELVYHLGEYARIAPSFENKQQVFDSNINGSFNIVSICSKLNIPLIYSASSTKFANEGINHSPYAYFKAFTVDLIKNYGEWEGLKYSICYFYNVYGSSTKTKWETNNYQSVIEVFKFQKQNNLPLTVCGDGEQKRDFIHVYDIVEGLQKIALSNLSHNDAWELGTGVNYSINRVYEFFNKRFNVEFENLPDQPGNYRKTLRENDDTLKLLNWTPKDRLKDHIKNL